jgi:hypothetical protein
LTNIENKLTATVPITGFVTVVSSNQRLLMLKTKRRWLHVGALIAARIAGVEFRITWGPRLTKLDTFITTERAAEQCLGCRKGKSVVNFRK